VRRVGSGVRLTIWSWGRRRWRRFSGPVGGGRMRALGGVAFGVVAVGAAVAVGASTFGGGLGGVVSAAAGGPAAAPMSQATSAGSDKGAVPAGASYSKYYGTVTIADGTLGGTTWKLQRTLGVGDANGPGNPNVPGSKCHASDVPFEQVYIQTADGVRDDAGSRPPVCGATARTPLPWDHSEDFRSVVYSSEWVVRLGTTAKEQSSKFGSVVVGLVDDTAVGKVVLKFNDGRALVTAQMVKAPAPENGTYFVIPLTDKADKGPENIPSDLVFYDLSGKVVSNPIKR
jgi:hypothetical protein